MSSPSAPASDHVIFTTLPTAISGTCHTQCSVPIAVWPRDPQLTREPRVRAPHAASACDSCHHPEGKGRGGGREIMLAHSFYVLLGMCVSATPGGVGGYSGFTAQVCSLWFLGGTCTGDKLRAPACKAYTLALGAIS